MRAKALCFSLIFTICPVISAYSGTADLQLGAIDQQLGNLAQDYFPPVHSVLHIAGTFPAALRSHEETGESLGPWVKDAAETVKEDTQTMLRRRSFSQVGSLGAEVLGANDAVKRGTGFLSEKVSDRLWGTKPEITKTADENYTIGGMQAKLSGAPSVTGMESNIKQYNLMDANFDGSNASRNDTTARHLDNSSRSLTKNRSKSNANNEDPDHQLIGEAPNAGQQLLNGVVNGLLGGQVPIQDNSRCGPGLHAADVDTPTPQSCY